MIIVRRSLNHNICMFYFLHYLKNNNAATTQWKRSIEPFCRLSFTIPHSFFRGNGYSIWRPFQQYFSYLVVVCYIGEGNRRTRRKPPTCRKPLTTFITKCCIKYTSPWAGFVLTTLVVIGNDCIGSYISNYHTITITTALIRFIIY